MEAFFLDQRWTSEGEPELGVGIVSELNKGRVQIKFPLSGEVRLYATEYAPLRRVRFKPGDTIVDVNDRPLVIEKVQEDGNLIMYHGQNRSLSEAELGNVSVKHGADDRLLMGDIDTPREFALRRRTLENDHKKRISPINGFIGGRIDLIPHQLYISHEVSQRYAPRVLLSDEVGLGKTIEACLILHRLLLSGRISRVMILVPDSLVHQWFVEILRRFNLWFHIFDEERCAALDESAPEGNPFLDDQLIICSTDFLASDEKRANQAEAAGWDMLVVDEAHHLKWSTEAVGPKYQVVEQLSKATGGLLLLTATPEQLGLQSHFARLRLLDPERYTNYESFKNESKDNKTTADIVEKLSLKKPLKASETALLTELFGKERLAGLKKGNETETDKLIEDLLDQHGPGRVIFRNTRAAMTGFPTRKAHLIPIEANEFLSPWIKQATTEFTHDIEPADTPEVRRRHKFTNDPRVEWLAGLLQKVTPNKVLLICKTKEKVLSLEKAIREVLNLKMGVFHEDLTLVQRDRNAAWFSETEGAQLLLCSEIGSEGRNFQFAHHLVLFDLPIHPELLEQRIGRLDRIGQTKDIQIHIPYLKGSPQEGLVRWYHEGLNAFEKNLEGGNHISQLFGERLREICLGIPSADFEKQLTALIADTHAFHVELRSTLASGRDRLLEMNSFRPKIAATLVEKIRAEDVNPALETYMNDIFEQYSLEVEDLAPRTYLLHTPLNDLNGFPSIEAGGKTVTFDRKRALSREEISFLSWDHPMVTGAIDMVLSTGLGSASFGMLRSSGAPAILLEVLFVLEIVGTNRMDVDRFLPNTPLRILVDHAGTDVTEAYPVEEVDPQLRPGHIDDLLDNEMLVEVLIPKMLTNATEIAEGRALKEISAGLYRMNSTMNHEIDRLKSLQEKNNQIRPDEILAALEAQTHLASLMKDARIRLDAVQLIQKGDF